MDNYGILVPQNLTKHKEIVAEAVTDAFSDPQVRTDLLIAVGAGVLSSIAVARAVDRMSAQGEGGTTRVLLKAGGLAVLTGSLSVLYKLYSVSAAKKTSR